jgi:hypothetical protein
MIWWIAIAAFVVLSALLLNSRITLSLVVLMANDDGRLTLQLKALFGLVKYRLDIPAIDMKGWLGGLVLKGERSNLSVADETTMRSGQREIDITLQKMMKAYRAVKRLVQATRDYSEWVDGLLRQWKCTRFRWVTRVGLGDAPATAVASGVLWSLKTAFVGYASRRTRMAARPELSVVPQFNQLQFSLDIAYIGHIRLGRALIAALSLLMRILKVKGGMIIWRNMLRKLRPQ